MLFQRQKTQEPSDEKGITATLDVMQAELLAEEQLAAEREHEDNKVSVLRTKVAALEEDLRIARERREQKEQAQRIRHIADQLGMEIASFAQTGAKILEPAKQLGSLMPGLAPDFLVRVETMISALQGGLKEQVADACTLAARLEAGNAAVVHPAPPKPEPEPVSIAVESDREQLFSLADLKWRDDTGRLLMVSKYSWVRLPLRLAAIAKSHNLADLPGSDRVARLAATHGVLSAATAPDLCVDLDAIESGSGLPRSVPRFVERVGPVRHGSVSVSRA